MNDCEDSALDRNREQHSVLTKLLALNAAMFFIEIAAAALSESTALLADSLDMLADAAVYGIGLYAVGKSSRHKSRVAYYSGLLEVGLGAGAGIQVVRKLIFGSEPEPALMIAIGILALLVNLACLALISRHREGEAHMRASWIFSKNDVLANLGVVTAGFLVRLTGSNLPDLAIGLLISAIVIKGGLQIIGETRALFAATENKA
ncbi:MAG: cation transporter [Gammaproteobacteria bacterium]